MLRTLFVLILSGLLSQPALSRTNNEISKQLYAAANQVQKTSPARAAKMRNDVASFMIDLNMLNFNENSASWALLSSGFYYDKKSINHFYSRHLGVYKSVNGDMMGVFDVNCEDVNDPQERMFGFVKTTEVYFIPSYKTKNGQSMGFMNAFCKQ